AAGVVPLVQSEAAHARDLGVEPGVMVAEEAHARARLREQLVEPGRLAEEALAAPVALEAHAGRSVVREDDVEPTVLAQRSDLVAGVVTLRVALQRLRRALEVRRAVAAADAAHAQRIAARDELVDLAVLQVVQAGQHLGRRLRVEAEEVHMVALDEHRLARGGAPFSDPRREVARAVVPLGGSVDAVRIGPNAEVADVKDEIEAHGERLLEREHARVHLVETPVDVARRAEDHGSSPVAQAQWIWMATVQKGRPSLMGFEAMPHHTRSIRCNSPAKARAPRRSTALPTPTTT